MTDNQPVSVLEQGNSSEERVQLTQQRTIVIAMLLIPFFVTVVGLGLYLALGAGDADADDNTSDVRAELAQLDATATAYVQSAQAAEATRRALLDTAVQDEELRATLEAAFASEMQAALEATLFALTPTPTFTPTPIPVSALIASHNPSLGPEDAPITIVEFSDYQCPFCTRFELETRGRLLEHYGNLIRFVYRDYPVIGGQSSAEAAAAVQCAGLQDKFWDFQDLIWANQALPAEERRALDGQLYSELAQTIQLDSEAFNQCIANEIGLGLVIIDFEAGREFVVNSTPTFFIEGERFLGAQPFENFAEVIDAALIAKGIEPPARS